MALLATSRREILALAGAGVAGAGISGLVSRAPESFVVAETIPFFGKHQAGITTPQQAHLVFAAFDVQATESHEVAALFRAWSAAAERLTAGRAVGPAGIDTGEALGSRAARLSLTFGVGRGLFRAAGEDRFGLNRHRPAALEPLPEFEVDELDPARSGGDLCVQACADDPQVAFHAIHNLERAATGVANLRWMQTGFLPKRPDSKTTPRNLMGFKDGTNNLRDPAEIQKHVWVGDEGPSWMRGGSYVVVRRIRMLLDVWDETSTHAQEHAIGRSKASGAPLGQAHERDRVNLDAQQIPVDAHIRLAAAEGNGGARLLRRGYSYTDGVDGETGRMDAGLVFIAYQRDPHEQFVRIQRSLATDRMRKFLSHTGSAVFACARGVQNGNYIFDDLFQS